jgi:uncharacterized protein
VSGPAAGARARGSGGNVRAAPIGVVCTAAHAPMSRFEQPSDHKQTTGLRFECTQCGKCCTRRDKYAHVYLDGEEVRNLARLLGLSVRSFRRKHTFADEYGWTQLRFSGTTCPFLDTSSNRCSAHHARPVQCRTFPFWSDLVDAAGWTDDARSMCEGIGRGPRVRAADVRAAMREMEDAD